MSSFYSEEELKTLGLKKYGRYVLISKKVSIYGPENISIGNNVRIDDFCILSGNIEIGNHVHISAYSALYGKYGIKIGDFCGISPRSTLLSATDDFSGQYMISPMVPNDLCNVSGGQIILEDFVQIGVNSVLMPAVCLKQGTACGAFSFINKSTKSWGIYVGIPIKRIKERAKTMIELSKNIESFELNS